MIETRKSNQWMAKSSRIRCRILSKGVPATQPWSHWIERWTPVTAPTWPAATASRIQARCGAQRPFWLTASCNPRASARSASSRPSARSCTNGFCDSTCWPASSAARISGARLSRMRRQVDDGDRAVADHVLDAVGGERVRKMLVAAKLRPLEMAVGNGDDIEPVPAIGLEMGEGDAAGADKADRDRAVPRHRRPVVDRRRRHLGRLGRDQGIESSAGMPSGCVSALMAAAPACALLRPSGRRCRRCAGRCGRAPATAAPRHRARRASGR